MNKTYYMCLNPLTYNWCLSTTKDYAYNDNLVFDSGWTNILKAKEAIENYIKEKGKKGIFIRLIKS